MNESYKTTKDIARGMYARRICGGGAGHLMPFTATDPSNQFDFSWINDCEIPGGELNHDAAWELFERAFTTAWSDFVKSK